MAGAGVLHLVDSTSAPVIVVNLIVTLLSVCGDGVEEELRRPVDGDADLTELGHCLSRCQARAAVPI
jgi:hypothetical protein